MPTTPPRGITPPTPGLAHEEPEQLLDEADIPSDDSGVDSNSASELAERR